MLQILRPTQGNVKPMPDVRYRISHLDAGLYWTGMVWSGRKSDAAIYSLADQSTVRLPTDGCWEIVTEPSGDLRKPLERSLVAQTITRYLWTQYCREEGLKVVPRLEDVAPEESKRFIDAGWFVTNLTLSPERFETALMALADTFCGDGDGVLNIFEVSPRTQKHYYELAVAGFFALQDNLKDEPSDWHYRDKLCRLLDAVNPKPQPEPNTQVHPIFRGILNRFAPKGGA